METKAASRMLAGDVAEGQCPAVQSPEDAADELLRERSIAALPDNALRRLLEDLRTENVDARTVRLARNHTKHTKKYSRW